MAPWLSALCRPCRGALLWFQHTHSCSQTSVTPVPEDLMSCSVPPGRQARTWRTYIHICKQTLLLSLQTSETTHQPAPWSTHALVPCLVAVITQNLYLQKRALFALRPVPILALYSTVLQTTHVRSFAC